METTIQTAAGYDSDNLCPVNISLIQTKGCKGYNVRSVRTEGAVNSRIAYSNSFPTIQAAQRAFNRQAKQYPNPPAIEDVDALTILFSAVIRNWFKPEEIEEARQKNATIYHNTDVCATHDYYDTNMAMDEAMKILKGQDWNFNLNNEAYINLWNNAWSKAKAAAFTHGLGLLFSIENGSPVSLDKLTTTADPELLTEHIKSLLSIGIYQAIEMGVTTVKRLK